MEINFSHITLIKCDSKIFWKVRLLSYIGLHKGDFTPPDITMPLSVDLRFIVTEIEAYYYNLSL
jgi:hypothetical protein